MLNVQVIVYYFLLCFPYHLCAGNDGKNYVNLSFNWKCSSNSDCSANGSTCIDELCQCPVGYIFNTKMTSCLKVATAYGDECEESIQCSRYLLTGGTCTNKACACAEGYYYMHGRCNAYSELFGPCKSDDECYVSDDFEASSCIDGICQCSPGFYQREYRNCRRIATKVGDPCLIDSDCKFSETASCTKDRVCVENTEATESEFSADFEVPEKTYPATQENFPFALGVGDKCTSDKDCADLGNAECSFSGVCECKRGDFLSKEKCIAELGESCEEGEVGGIAKSICRNGRWACDEQRVVGRNRRKCEKVSVKYNVDSCLKDEWCYVFGPDAVCKKTCICNEKSRIVESEHFCWTRKGYGEKCQQDIDCYEDGINSTLACLNNICSCPEGSGLNSKRTKCIVSSGEIGDACEEDVSCSIENSNCKNERCACIDGHYELNGDCVPGINATCTSDKDCTPKNSKCLSNTCSCDKDHAAASIGSCVPVSSHGKSCEHDIQCSAVVENAICASVDFTGIEITLNDTENVANKTCVCNEGYRYKLNRCLKKRVLSESCVYREECYLDFDEKLAVCRNGRCACDWGYTGESDTVCRKTSANFKKNNAAQNVVPRLFLVLIPIVTFVSLM